MSGDPPSSSLPPGMADAGHAADRQRMSTAVRTKIAPENSSRLLADVNALGDDDEKREPALARLEEAIGRDFADRLVAALSSEDHKRR